MTKKVIVMVFDVIDLDLDISRSFDSCACTIFPCMAGVIFEGICSLLAEIYNIEIWKNSLYPSILVDMETSIFVDMEMYVTFFSDRRNILQDT